MKQKETSVDMPQGADPDSAAILVAGIIQFLQSFAPITLTKRVTAMLPLALGILDGRVAELVGFGDRTVRGLRKQVRSLMKR